MKFKATIISLALIVFSLGVVASSTAAKPTDKPSNKPEKTKKVVYVFRGVYQGDGQVLVNKGNAWVKKNNLKGKVVSFDFSTAKLSVADTDLSGVIDLGDFQLEDTVVVKSKLPKKAPEEPF